MIIVPILDTLTIVAENAPNRYRGTHNIFGQIFR
jgi:hypothetical protein